MLILYQNDSESQSSEYVENVVVSRDRTHDSVEIDIVIDIDIVIVI